MIRRIASWLFNRYMIEFLRAHGLFPSGPPRT